MFALDPRLVEHGGLVEKRSRDMPNVLQSRDHSEPMGPCGRRMEPPSCSEDSLHVFPSPSRSPSPSHDGMDISSAGVGGLVRAPSLLANRPPPPQALLLSLDTRDRLRLFMNGTGSPLSRESLNALPRFSVRGDNAAPDASSVTS